MRVEIAYKPSDFTEVVSAKDVARKMKLDYSRGIKDNITRDLEAVCGLCRMLERPDLDTDAFTEEAANLISKIFGIDTVAIGVRDPVDKLYKYRAVVGLEKEAEEGYKSLAYTREQLLEPSTYPSYEISDHTRLFLTEDHPYAAGEESTYHRPGLIGLKRRTITDCLEADYMDFFFYGPGGDVLGFIETSGTRLRKLPDTATIRWIELIASIMGIVLQAKK